jgi:hypothetical protein
VVVIQLGRNVTRGINADFIERLKHDWMRRRAGTAAGRANLMAPVHDLTEEALGHD